MTQTPFLITLGNVLKTNRKKAGFSQEAFAHDVGLARSHYGSIERGERNLSVGKLRDICKVLNLPMSELMQQVEKDAYDTMV